MSTSYSASLLQSGYGSKNWVHGLIYQDGKWVFDLNPYLVTTRPSSFYSDQTPVELKFPGYSVGHSFQGIRLTSYVDLECSVQPRPPSLTLLSVRFWLRTPRGCTTLTISSRTLPGRPGGSEVIVIKGERIVCWHVPDVPKESGLK